MHNLIVAITVVAVVGPAVHFLFKHLNRCKACRSMNTEVTRKHNYLEGIVTIRTQCLESGCRAVHTETLPTDLRHAKADADSYRI